MNLLEALDTWKTQTDQRLDQLLPKKEDIPILLHEAMRYSCLSEGKRIRPMFCYGAAQAIGNVPQIAFDVGCAIEMVHCFSLIHDDLPCIDNDDLRRGQPTCHKVYGEAIAVLAGDALMALAFETLGNLSANPSMIKGLVMVLSRSLGSQGLVGGEVLDILSEGKHPTIELVEMIHLKKTAALISGSTRMGSILLDASLKQMEILSFYGESVGLAFQIVDDILDETATKEQLGKSVRSDREKSKMTYPAVMGVEGARKKAQQLIEEACLSLIGLPGDTSALEGLAGLSLRRLV